MITPCDHSYDPTQLDSTKPFSLVGSFGVIAATIRLNQTVRLSRVVWCDHGCDPTRLNGLVELDRIVWCDRTLSSMLARLAMSALPLGCNINGAMNWSADRADCNSSGACQALCDTNAVRLSVRRLSCGHSIFRKVVILGPFVSWK